MSHSPPPPENHYKEKLQHRCCKDGLREIAMPYSCTRRSLYITEGWECMRAFRYCCSTYRDQVFDAAVPTTPPPTTEISPTISLLPLPSFSHQLNEMSIDARVQQRQFFGNSCTSNRIFSILFQLYLKVALKHFMYNIFTIIFTIYCVVFTMSNHKDI